MRSRSLCSVADAGSSSDSLDVEDGILEPETTSTVDVIEDCNADEEVGEELASEPGILDDDLFDTEKGVVGEESHKKKASLELCKAIMDAPSHSVASVLDKWLAEGNDLNRLSISKIIVSLRKRRMYGKTLQVLFLDISLNKLLCIFFFHFLLQIMKCMSDFAEMRMFACTLPVTFLYL